MKIIIDPAVCGPCIVARGARPALVGHPPVPDQAMLRPARKLARLRRAGI